MTAHLAVRGVSKSFTSKRETTQVLAPLDLELERGEFVALVGPSGCGKSTLLSIIAGLLERDAGTLELGGEPITGPGPDRGVVFQQHVLLPWLTAQENVRFAVDCARVDLSESAREELTRTWIKAVHLEHAAGRRPGQLSGGMQQRVGLARAFALEPEVLLLDEPFGALDALTRISLQDQLLEVWDSQRRTVVMVTHDVDEALLLSDRVVVMSHGPSAHIKEEFLVPFSRPRDRIALARTQDYNDLRAAMLQSLTAELAAVRA